MTGATFLRSGGFRPRLLPHYLSDYEFTLRLARRGTELVVDESFVMQSAPELTGLNKPSSRTLRGVWNEAFSNRAKFNPKHWSAFAVMVCPPWTVPLHLVRIWLIFLRHLAAAVLPPQEGNA
jgi:hypothetical protein